MGGEVFVGIRMPDGAEHCSLRWTNIMPAFLASPSFYNRGKAFKDFIGRAKSRNRWPKSKLVKQIQPSEYGVILVDFQAKCVFSRQGYAKPGSVCLQLNQGIEDRKLLRDLIQAGMFLKLRDGMTNRKIPKNKEARIFSAISLDKKTNPGFVECEYLPQGWTFDHKLDKASSCWHEVITFINSHGWVSRTWSLNRVSRDGRIALVNHGVVKYKRNQ